MLRYCQRLGMAPAHIAAAALKIQDFLRWMVNHDELKGLKDATFKVRGGGQSHVV